MYRENGTMRGQQVMALSEHRQQGRPPTLNSVSWLSSMDRGTGTLTHSPCVCAFLRSEMMSPFPPLLWRNVRPSVANAMFLSPSFFRPDGDRGEASGPLQRRRTLSGPNRELQLRRGAGDLPREVARTKLRDHLLRQHHLRHPHSLPVRNNGGMDTNTILGE